MNVASSDEEREGHPQSAVLGFLRLAHPPKSHEGVAAQSLPGNSRFRVRNESVAPALDP